VTQGAEAEPGRRSLAALATICLVLFLTFLDTTVVSVILADVQSSLHAGVQSLQWVVNAYALPFAALMLPAGALGDRFGRRKLMLAGVVVFAAGSVLAAAAATTGVLLAARVVMGVGAAASEPGTLSLLRHLFPVERERAWALGVWAAVAGLALALGPVIGGVLVGYAGWRSVFWLNLGLAVVALGGVLATVPETADRLEAPADVRGFLLAALALTAATYATVDGEQRGYTNPFIVGLYVLGAVTAVGFVLVERRAASPLIPLSLFRSPEFSVPLAVVFALYFGVFALFFFGALYLQVVVGTSGYGVAARFAGMAVAMVGASLFTGRWVARAGPRPPLLAGCLLAATGLLLSEEFLTPHPSAPLLTVALAVAGLGFGVAVVPATSEILAAVPPQRSGMAASATNTSRVLGSLVGVAVLGALVNAHLTRDLTERLAALGVPATFQDLVVNAIEHGGVPSGGAAPAQEAAFGPLVAQVIDAAYSAFGAGLHVALVTSAVLVLLAGGLAAVGLRRPAAVSRAG